VGVSERPTISSIARLAADWIRGVDAPFFIFKLWMICASELVQHIGVSCEQNTMNIEIQFPQIGTKTVDSGIYDRKDVWSINVPFFQCRFDLIVIFWPPKHVMISLNYRHVKNKELK
jgi:hypothetical protein